MRCRPLAANDEPDVNAGPALRPVTFADRGTIQGWLQNPGVQRWWGNVASADAGIRLALDSDAACCRMIEIDGLAVGYAQAVDGGFAGTSRPPQIPPGTWDCDLFIASEPHRGQGHGQAALDLLVTEVFGSTLTLACMIVVPVRKERAVRACESAGFRWVAVSEDPIHGPSWVMLRERPRR